MKSLSFLKNSTAPSGSDGAEIDLDVRPMMNVLLILIPFLVSVAEYTHLSIVEMSLPPNVGAGIIAAAPAEKPKLKITVVLGVGYLSVTRGEVLLDSISNAGREYDYQTLSARLKERRIAADIQDEVVVAVKDPVAFKYVVRVMDICRETGFEKVGLAAAAENTATGQ